MTLSWRTKNNKNQQQFSFFLLRIFFSDILCLKYPPTNVFYIYHTRTAQDFGSNCPNSVFPETCFDQRPAAPSQVPQLPWLPEASGLGNLTRRPRSPSLSKRERRRPAAAVRLVCSQACRLVFLFLGFCLFG